MKLNADIQTHFNRALRIGVLIAILLITVGGVIYLIHHGAQNFHIETTVARLNFQSHWLILIKAGISLLILLQIIRILFFSVVFYFSNNLILSLMSLFITLTLSYSLINSIN